MRFLPLLLLVPALVAFAPAPGPRPDVDPDKAIDTYDRDVKALNARLAYIRKRLFDQLREQQNRLEKRGKPGEADRVRQRLLLLESIDDSRPLGHARTCEVLKEASVRGKYRHLQRVLYVPADNNQFHGFHDYGFWNGNAYHSYTNLPSGYWVYIHSRWFIWRDASGK